MKRTIIAMLLVLAFGVGCNKGQDRQLADGTKIFGERTLKDGTLRTERVEYPDGEKQFDVTQFPEGSKKASRVETSDGRRIFNETWLQDGAVRAERLESPDGKKQFNVTLAAPIQPQSAGQEVTTPSAPKLAAAWKGSFPYLGMRTGMTKKEAIDALNVYRDMTLKCNSGEREGILLEGCLGHEKELDLEPQSQFPTQPVNVLPLQSNQLRPAQTETDVVPWSSKSRAK